MTITGLVLLFAHLAGVVLGSSDTLHLPLTRRRTVNPDLDHWANAAQRLGNRYSSTTLQKRQNSSAVPLINLEGDSSYLATILVGTPPQSVSVTMDTGSADLWLATVGCMTCTRAAPLFDPTRSSSFQMMPGSVEISYGSGNVFGPLSTDTVTMGGYTVPSQVFVTANRVTDDLVGSPFPGFMGLGFETLAVTRAVPFWQALLNNQRFSSPLFSFWLTRFGNDSAATELEPGGILTLGGTNSSLYTGNIEFIDFPAGSTPSYWLLSLTVVTVNGMQISIAPSNSLSIIDTGTTLIGGTTEAVRSIYAALPGARALGGLNAGLYAVSCTTTFQVSMSFGGTLWPISSDDMLLTTNSPGVCIGAIIDLSSVLGTGGRFGGPQWIIGDTFLKNVYSVFRATPPSVGFAQLSRTAGGPASLSLSSTVHSSSTFAFTPSSSPQSTQASGTLSKRNRISILIIVASLVAGCLPLVW